MPSIKPHRDQQSVKEKQPRKPRFKGFARQRAIPTHWVEHVLESCPECGTGLAGGWGQRTREVIDLPLVPVQVTEHVFIARTCPVCERRRIPRADLGGVVLGQQRLGVNLLSLIAALREKGRLPWRTIQWYLKTVHQLNLSLGAIVGAVHQVAQKAQPTVTEIRDRIRASPVVHADETGWREDGVNGYVWTFSTPTERYFLRRGRNKEEVDEALGDSFDGVLVSDFYAAYHHYPGLKQRCWVHLLRDIHDLKVPLPPRPGTGPVGGGSPPNLPCRRDLRPSPDPATPAGPTTAGTEDNGPLPPLPQGPGGGPGQAVPAHGEAHQGAVCLRGRAQRAAGEQRRGTEPAASGGQPQNQRRHPLGTGHHRQDDPGLSLRNLGRPGTGPPIGLPPVARFPSTLNCYFLGARAIALDAKSWFRHSCESRNLVPFQFNPDGYICRSLLRASPGRGRGQALSGEPPVDDGASIVALAFERGDLPSQQRFIADPAVQTRSAEDAQLDLGHPFGKLRTGFNQLP